MAHPLTCTADGAGVTASRCPNGVPLTVTVRQPRLAVPPEPVALIAYAHTRCVPGVVSTAAEKPWRAP
jgi:hypothetical protein